MSSSRDQKVPAADLRWQPTHKAKNQANVGIPETLDDAIHQLVYGSAVPAKALATAVGVRFGYLYDAANPNEDTQFQARLIAPLTNASGNDALIRFLAHACGGVFIRLAMPAAGQLDEDTAAVLHEFSEYLREVAEAHADGTVTKDEARRVRLEAEEAIEALLRAVAHVEAQAEEE